MFWKTIKSKALVKHSRISVYEDIVELPGGHKTDYVHFGEMPEAVTILAQNDQGKFLLQKEYSYPPNERLYQFPGGAAEPGEQLLTAAKRELAEEAKLDGKLVLLGSFFTNNRRSKQKLHVYLATDLRPVKAGQDLEEEFEDFWLPEEKIDRMIAGGEIIIASALAAWSILKAKRL